MVKAVRHALRIGLAALVLGGLGAGPAMAVDSSSPDAQYYEPKVTEIRPAVPGLEVKVSSEDGQLTVVNHTGKTVTVVGLSGEDYLRITPTGSEENTGSLTSAMSPKGSGDDSATQPKIQMPVTGKPATWVKRSDQPTITWRDYRVQWNNTQRPPIVVSDPHSEHKVFSWGVNLKVGTQPVLVLGEVMWTGTPWVTTTQLALIGVAVVVVLFAAWVVLRRRSGSKRGRRGRGGPQAESGGDTGRAPVPSMRGN